MLCNLSLKFLLVLMCGVSSGARLLGSITEPRLGINTDLRETLEALDSISALETLLKALGLRTPSLKSPESSLKSSGEGSS